MTVFLLVITTASIVTRQELGAIIVLTFLDLMSLILVLYLNLYRIYVYDVKIEIKSIFGSKKYDYSQIIVETGNSIQIKSLEHKELTRIAGFLDREYIIYKSYNKYRKEFKIKSLNTNNRVTYNFFVRNFIINS